MSVGDLILQNFFGIVQGVITAVAGYLAVRILRGIRASTVRTEVHAAETAKTVSALDKISTGSFQSELEEWRREIETRVEAVAESKSDTLAWQAYFDRRLAAVEQFARALDEFAHGRAPVPTYTAPVTTTEADLITEGAPHD